MKKRLVTLTILLTILLAVTGYAQQGQVSATHASQIFVYSINNQDQDELASQEKMLAELKKLRQEVESLRVQTSLMAETLDVYKKIDEARSQQVSILKSAIADRDNLGGLQDKKEELYKQEIELLKSENSRLKEEISSLKKSKLLSKLGSGLLTVAIAFAASR